MTTPSAPRYALYYLPEPGTALERLGSLLLGRDSHGGLPLTQPVLGSLDQRAWHALTAVARGYGLHATLKPPFFLPPGNTEALLLCAAEDFARQTKPAPLPDLELERIGSFLALGMRTRTPEEKARAKTVRLLADDVVTAFDRFRAPPSEAEMERRRARGLSPRQERYLGRWGYPYVFEEYRFHLTLTDRITDPGLTGRLRAELRERLAPALCGNVIRALSVCRSGTDGTFALVESFPFGA